MSWGAKKLESSRQDSISGTPLQTAHESDPRRCYVAVDRVVGVLWLSVQTQGAAWGWWCSPSTCIFNVPSISFHPFPSPHPSTCAHRWAGQPLGVFAMGVDVVDNDAKASPRSLPIAFRAFGRSNSVTSRQAHSTFHKSPKFAYLF